jgi:serine/threonine-protein kinase
LEPLGTYRLIKPIGQGGMAAIWLARQILAEGAERTVVVKRILPQLTADAEAAAMFFDEAQLAAQLDHDNVVRILDFGRVEGAFSICMEHLVGDDLANLAFAARQRGERVPADIAAPTPCAATTASPSTSSTATSPRRMSSSPSRGR